MITFIVVENEKKVFDLMSAALRKEGYSFMDEPESGGLVKIIKKKDITDNSSPIGSHIVMLKDLLLKDNKGKLYKSIMPEIERPLIESVLESTEGNKSKAAKILGINRNTLNAKIKNLGLAGFQWKNKI